MGVDYIFSTTVLRIPLPLRVKFHSLIPTHSLVLREIKQSNHDRKEQRLYKDKNKEIYIQRRQAATSDCKEKPLEKLSNHF